MTRGRVKDQKKIALTGNVYLKYQVEEHVKFTQGDILCALNNDANSPIKGEYNKLGYAGYFKIYVYDGREFQHLIDSEFFEERENHFSKKEYPIDNYNLIKGLLTSKCHGKIVYRTYRDHYTLYLHEMAPFKGKKGLKPLPKLCEA